MEEDEIVVDEPIVEEQEIIEEEVEEETNDSPTLEDYNKLKKEKATLVAQKNHWKKKAEGSKETIEPKPLIKENNKTQSSTLTREEAILFAKGYTEEEVDLANRLAKVNGIGILEAIEDDYLKNKRDLRLKTEKSEKASLPASNGIGKIKADKPIGEMTPDEHKAYFDKVMGN